MWAHWQDFHWAWLHATIFWLARNPTTDVQSLTGDLVSVRCNCDMTDATYLPLFCFPRFILSNVWKRWNKRKWLTNLTGNTCAHWHIVIVWPWQAGWSMIRPDSSGNLNKYFHDFFYFFSFLSWCAACRVGMFGRNCLQSCSTNQNCKGLRFCLPDPYGCSCASGWFGSRCERG